jgi:hypothetical protein
LSACTQRAARKHALGSTKLKERERKGEGEGRGRGTTPLPLPLHASTVVSK